MQYLSWVFGPVMSSKRMLYPTCSPRVTSISSATRCATLIAATRLGWVHATSLLFRTSRPHCGIWVVLPDPVSPTSTMVLLALIISINFALCSHTCSRRSFRPRLTPRQYNDCQRADARPVERVGGRSKRGTMGAIIYSYSHIANDASIALARVAAGCVDTYRELDPRG